MFRVQVTPRALNASLSGFVDVLYHEFGRNAVLDNELLVFIEILRDEMGHPAFILTRRQLDAAFARALRRTTIRREFK